MTLIVPGYYQSTFWVENYWQQDYWQEHGSVTINPSRTFTAQQKALAFIAQQKALVFTAQET
jgi:hypothetical protein